jgi:hypothetical protein
MLSDKRRCSNKVRIICNCTAICENVTNIYCCVACAEVICHFWIIILKDNEDWLLVFTRSARRGFWPLGPAGERFVAEGRKKLDHPGVGHVELCA